MNSNVETVALQTEKELIVIGKVILKRTGKKTEISSVSMILNELCKIKPKMLYCHSDY